MSKATTGIYRNPTRKMALKYSIETGEKNQFHAADYAVFAVTLGLSASVGLYYAIKDRKKKTTDDYLLGGRNMHVFPVAMSLLSSFISAITILGTPAEMYAYNTMFWYISVGFIFTIVGAANIFMPVFYKLRITSTFEYIEMRFGKLVRIVSCLIYIVWMLLFMAIILYGPSLALYSVSGLSLWGSIIAVSLVCTFYTTLGGMKAVLWADTIQMVIMMSGLLTLLILGSQAVGGFDKVWKIADEHNRIELQVVDPNPAVRHSVWNLVFGAGMLWCSIYGINQAQVQRIISVSTLTKAKVALWLNVPGMILVQTITCMVGVTMFAFYHKCDPVKFGLVDKSDQLIPLFMLDTLGEYHGLPGLFLSCIFSGSLSSISSGLNAMAAVIVKDFVKPYCCQDISEARETILSKGVVCLFGVISLLLAFVVSQMGAILQAAYLSFGILGGPLLGLFVLGMMFPWANKWGALVGHLTALVLVCWIAVGAQVNRVIEPPLPVRTDGCNWNVTLTNTTTSMPVTTVAAMSTTPPSVSPVMQLYTLSYQWYTATAVLTTVVVGLIVSFITGYTRPETIDPRLISPVFDTFLWFLPERIRKPLRFGVRHGEVPDDTPRITDSEFSNAAVTEGNGTADVKCDSNHGNKIDQVQRNPDNDSESNATKDETTAL